MPLSLKFSKTFVIKKILKNNYLEVFRDVFDFFKLEILCFKAIV